MPVIEVRDLVFVYPGAAAPVLDGFELSVEPGEIVALVGPSGCGKSTVLRLLAGLERPRRGRISIGGRLMADGRTFVPPERRGVGMVFQDFALFPHLTVEKNIAYGINRLPRAERRERLQAMLALTGLAELAHRYPHQLSGGQQQRVALARALAPGPAVLLLDEPFSSLDAHLRDRLRGEVRRIIRAAGTTALFVTHDRQDVQALADRCVEMG
ncbi:ABC transporter ATP-binding protein [Desulfurispora thermophila]|uniref:ABC transporter ATP-binding protein n=1 Tax=Desulfurispora thermophila TaxID=265470 RepID=UPI000364B7FA|nr:ABC transporter ATP-binding protein [Desulfurispora thermophila]